MALSVINYFLWDLEDKRVHFMLADCAVILGLQVLEHRLKKSKKAREEEEAKKKFDVHEMEKKQSKAMSKKLRDENRRTDHAVHTDKVSAKTRGHKIPNPTAVGAKKKGH